MEVIYALEDLSKTITKSIFLAGPTPRSEDGNPWRQDALKILEDIGFEDGTVFVPEPRDQKWHGEYDRQIEWEELCLNVADCIVFWIPRDLETMPAFTTNIEWGRWENSGKIVLGFPEEAQKMSYINLYAEKNKIESQKTLTTTLEKAIEFIGEGAPRNEGERHVPLFIWNTSSFQSWYKAQLDVGNHIETAKLIFNYRIRNGFPFLWVLKADIYVAKEDRIKKNDFVLARTDISSVMLWKPNEPLEASELVLVREFRPSVSNKLGFVLELPSGSSSDPSHTDPLIIAAEEVNEETGFFLDSERMKSHGARQLASTLSAHKSHLFSAELTEEELTWFKSQADVAHGNVKDGERTYIEVKSLKDLWDGDSLDWTAIGQIMTVIHD